MINSKIIFSLLVITLISLFFGPDLLAQCPMCRMTAESNMANGGSAGKGLNNGILYIFVMPYLLVSVIGYLWWKNKKKKNKEEAQILSE